MIGVVIVAAYPAVRAGLRALVADESEITVLASRADASDDDTPDALVAPDVLLVDLDAGRGNLLARLAARYPDAGQVLLLDVAETYPFLNDASRAARPWAALPRDADADQILAAVRAVARGLVVLDPAIARRLHNDPPIDVPPDEPLHEPLTEREQQVLGLLALGIPNKTIALRLGISEHTAKFHVGSILAKLGAASRTEAVAQAARRGLLVL